MKNSVRLDVASVKAQALLHHLAPVSERIEVAGSIRRGLPTVGDIEIVLLPRMYPPEDRDLFGNPVGEPSDRIDTSISEANRIESCSSGTGRGAWLERLNKGKRYIKLRDRYLDLQIDLFVVRPPAEWGPIFAIRTGSALFSQRLVTGLHRKGLRCRGGRVVDKRGRAISSPTEEMFFKLCGVEWTKPSERKS